MPSKKVSKVATDSKTVQKVLILRTVKSDMSSHGGFVYPVSGPVSAPDWAPTIACGAGLHGLLWGEGAGGLLDWSDTAKWLVLEVNEADIIDLTAVDNAKKCKFPAGTVVHCGDRISATAYIAQNGGAGRAIVGGNTVAGNGGTATAGNYGTATAGDSGTATAGESGTATAGNYGTATAGDRGTATAGECGTATAGYRGTATAGEYGTATAGYYGTATAGNYGTATAGDYGTVTAGECGTATAGYRGTATAGEYGTATAGYRGTATAGYSGIICLKYYDFAKSRYFMVVGHIGKKGLKADVKYKLSDKHKFVKA